MSAEYGKNFDNFDVEENEDDVFYPEDGGQGLIKPSSDRSRFFSLLGKSSFQLKAGELEALSQRSEDFRHQKRDPLTSLLLSREQRKRMRRESASNTKRLRLSDTARKSPVKDLTNDDLFKEKDLFRFIIQDEKHLETNTIETSNANRDNLNVDKSSDVQSENRKTNNEEHYQNTYQGVPDQNGFSNMTTLYEHGAHHDVFNKNKEKGFNLDREHFLSSKKSEQKDHNLSQHPQQKRFNTDKPNFSISSKDLPLSSKKRKGNKKVLALDSFQESTEYDVILNTARKASNLRKKTTTFSGTKKKKNNSPSRNGLSKAKSIVGHRPKHWGNQSLSSRSFLSSNSKNVAQALSQATKSSFPNPRRFSSAKTKKYESFKAETASNHINYSKPIREPANATLENCTNDEASEQRIQAVFRPSKLNKNLSKIPFFESIVNEESSRRADRTINQRATSPIEDESFIGYKSPIRGENRSTQLSPNVTRTSSNNSRKGRGSKEGSLMKQLRSMRNKDSANCVRLRSGSYSFGSNDLNDPRNRAEISIDVSILSGGSTSVSYVPDFIKSDNGVFSIFLGYVHNLYQRSQKNHLKNLPVERTTKDSLHQTGNLVQDLNTHTLKKDTQSEPGQLFPGARGEKDFHPHFAWICFSSSTVSEQNIKKNSPLRLYDCVFVQAFHSRETIPDGLQEKNLKLKKLPTIICTRLCEEYHVSLPPLQMIPSIFE